MNSYLYPDFFLMNLLKLIQKGESETVEFKQNFDKEAIISTGAMANRKGGIILIGVNDKREIKGNQIGKETLQQWSNQVAQVTEPRLLPVITAEKVNGKTLVIIQIAEYPIKPISVNGRCYMRVGNSNKQLGAKQISDLHLQSLNLSWDSYIATGKTMKDIDMQRVKRFIGEVNREGRRELKGNPIQLLHKLEMVKDNKPTWACCLLFKKNPYGSPHATIRIARFKGTATIIDDNVIEGPLLDQVNAAINAIKKNINVRYEIKGRIRRKEVWDYPVDAIREAVLNAVCHRDYRAIADTQIKIYDDYIHIWNPGELPHNISIDDLLNNKHISSPRNKLVTQAFYDLGSIERLGSGIERILNSCRDAGMPAPEFREEMNGFSVTFRKAVMTSEEDEYREVSDTTEHYFTPKEKKLIAHIQKEGRITNSEYQKLFKVSKRTASRELSELIKKQVLIKKGTTGKGTEYFFRKGKLKGTQRGHKGDTKGTQS